MGIKQHFQQGCKARLLRRAKSIVISTYTCEWRIQYNDHLKRKLVLWNENKLLKQRQLSKDVGSNFILMRRGHYWRDGRNRQIAAEGQGLDHSSGLWAIRQCRVELFGDLLPRAYARGDLWAWRRWEGHGRHVSGGLRPAKVTRSRWFRSHWLETDTST